MMVLTSFTGNLLKRLRKKDVKDVKDVKLTA